MTYCAVGTRCALHLPSLNLNLPPTYDEAAVLEILCDHGFNVVPIDLITLARSLVGVATYRLKADLSEAPGVFDCSSFTKYLYAQKGIWIPRLSVQQRQIGSVTENPLPGDLVFTAGLRGYFDTDPRDTVGHVGIATADGTVIHAKNRTAGVVESTFSEFYESNPRGIRSLILPGTITLEQREPRHLIETADDFRWLILKQVY